LIFRKRRTAARAPGWRGEARRRGQRKAAETLNLPAPMVVAALNYAAEYPEEIADDARRGHRPLKACGLEVPA
jgi:hypothetical protein